MDDKLNITITMGEAVALDRLIEREMKKNTNEGNEAYNTFWQTLSEKLA